MFNFGFFHKTGGGHTGGGSGGSTSPVPHVVSSEIIGFQRDGVLVTWDMDMNFSGPIKGAISVTKNGTDINVLHIERHATDPRHMGIICDGDFNANDVVKWSYDDAHATDKIISAAGRAAELGTYDVVNELLYQPKVLFSKVEESHRNRILVEWDSTMAQKSDLRFGIVIVINNERPIIPFVAHINDKFMALALGVEINKNDVVTWAYDAHQAVEPLTSIDGIEVKSETHAIENLVTTTRQPIAFNSGFSGGFK